MSDPGQATAKPVRVSPVIFEELQRRSRRHWWDRRLRKFVWSATFVRREDARR